jgi:hypothetical protein
MGVLFMRRRDLIAAAVVAAASCLLGPAQLSAQDDGPMHAPDYRAQQILIALYFGPKANAPFSATAKTVWVKIMPDDSTVTTWNERAVARDMDGRIFEERRFLVPDNSKDPPGLRLLEYSDPQQHALYNCNPNSKRCDLYNYFPGEMQPPAPVGLQPDGTTYLTRENLGVDTFEGLEVQRSRETYTYYKQTIGNTKTILRTVEYWYSPALGVNVQVKRHDPRDGDQTLWLTNISLTAADSETFQIPADYQVFDRRIARPVPRGQVEEPQ